MASVAVRSTAVGTIVVNSLFFAALIDCGCFVVDPCFVVWYVVSFLVSQSSR